MNWRSEGCCHGVLTFGKLVLRETHDCGQAGKSELLLWDYLCMSSRLACTQSIHVGESMHVPVHCFRSALLALCQDMEGHTYMHAYVEGGTLTQALQSEFVMATQY